MGGEGEGSGMKGGGKWGAGTPCPPPLINLMKIVDFENKIL